MRKKESRPLALLLLALLAATGGLEGAVHSVSPGDGWPTDLSPGDEILLRAGFHLLPAMDFTAAVTLRGEAQTRLSPAVPIEGSEFLRFRHDVEINGLTMDLGETDMVAVSAGGGTVAVTEVQFLGGASAVHLHHPTDVTVTSTTLRNQSGLGVRVLSPRGNVRIEDLRFEGQRFLAGLQIVGGADSGTLTLEGVGGSQVAHTSDWLGFITLARPEFFRSVRVEGLNLDGAFQGTGLTLQSDPVGRGPGTVEIGNVRLTNWERGLHARAAGAGGLGLRASLGAEGAASLVVSGSEVGVLLEGRGLQADLRGLRIVHTRSGLRIGHNADALIRESHFSANTREDLRVETGGTVTLRETEVTPMAAGIRLADGAGRVDLGTEAEGGGNTFHLRATRTWAISLEEDRTLDLFGNRWTLNGIEVHGHVAIDDLVANGSPDNPVAEPGRGIIRLEQGDETGSGRVRWDTTASRATPGYGNSVFRSEEEMRIRFHRIRRLELGPGEYRALPDPTTGLQVRGSGRGNTVLLPPEDLATPWIRGAGELRLSHLTMRFPDDASPCAAIDWEGLVDLQQVRIENAPSAPILLLAPGRAETTLRGTEIALAPSSPSRGEVLLDLSGRSPQLAGLRLEGGSFRWQGDGETRLRGNGLDVRSPSPTEWAVHLVGDAQLTDTTVETEGALGIVLEQGEDDSAPGLRRYRVTGFREAGVVLRSGAGRSALEEGFLEASGDVENIAAGYVLEGGGEVHITLAEGRNLRPGVDVRTVPDRLVLRQVALQLDTAFNSLSRQDDGIRFAAPLRERVDPTEGERTEEAQGPRIQILRAAITGYDAAIHVAPSHSDKTPIEIGNRTGVGANYLGRNSVGIRVSSASADVRIQENLNNSLVSENGVGILVEAGNVQVSGFRVIGNQVGVVARGGVVDLGGGPLRSIGRNLLWPQAGALAIVNESPDDAPVHAIGNAWGDAAPRIGTENEPVRGRVITLRPSLP